MLIVKHHMQAESRASYVVEGTLTVGLYVHSISTHHHKYVVASKDHKLVSAGELVDVTTYSAQLMVLHKILSAWGNNMVVYTPNKYLCDMCGCAYKNSNTNRGMLESLEQLGCRSVKYVNVSRKSCIEVVKVCVAYAVTDAIAEGWNVLQ